jgi:hypothetical protein
VRDPDGRATDAAVVVKHSVVTLERCRLSDNIGDSAIVHATVVGIAGVAGRENGRIVVTDCRITRNSWGGIALYRGAHATIRNNVIDGVDKARGSRIGGGRGVGIGVTWDARAVIENNLVRRYWKGIGVFVDANATIRRNIVEDILTWGIAYWGAETGQPVAQIEENIVYRTGACGVIIDRSSPMGAEPPGYFRGNLVIETGRDERYDSGEPYCFQRPLALHAVPDDFEIENNTYFGNRQPGTWPKVEEVSERELADVIGRIMQHIGGPANLQVSFFARRFRP